ncbi:hypothetical protein LLG90_13540 [Aromatoleum toluclasticum]|uniref:hypothetical protein n=1 Tax=Aromatoleum toluclasticum TaxID=92003 RepID=UPI001D17D6DE|nr:hypothetical protein [Aromatoleum toluclasticum]MCC4116378.1 hypothetical protein [Aromatoleum toluclasticum]
MNAPNLPDRILGKIAKANGQRPARAADVLALVGGAEPGFWAAVEQLYREHRINTAHIQKKGDPEPWLAIWPTGVCLPAAPQSGKTLSGLFVRHRLGDFHAAHAPRSNPKPEATPKPAPNPKTEPNKEPVMDMPTNIRRPHGTLQDAIAQHLTGRGAAGAVTVAELANLLCDAPQNIRFAVQAMAKKGVLLVTERKNGGRTAAAYYDAATVAAEAPAASQESAAVPTVAEEPAAISDALATAEPEPAATSPVAVDRRAPQPLYRDGDLTVAEIHDDLASLAGAAAEPVRVRLALWDDGTLVIADGDEILQYPADVTRRLALLLGVPCNPIVSPIGA